MAHHPDTRIETDCCKTHCGDELFDSMPLVDGNQDDKIKWVGRHFDSSDDFMEMHDYVVYKANFYARLWSLCGAAATIIGSILSSLQLIFQENSKSEAIQVVIYIQFGISMLLLAAGFFVNNWKGDLWKSRAEEFKALAKPAFLNQVHAQTPKWHSLVRAIPRIILADTEAKRNELMTIAVAHERAKINSTLTDEARHAAMTDCIAAYNAALVR